MTQTPNPLSNNESVKRETPKMDFGSRSQADELLKPCPFCGSKLIDVVKRTAWNTPTYARCTDCGSRGSDIFTANQEDTWKTLVPLAVKHWNMRTPNQTVEKGR